MTDETTNPPGEGGSIHEAIRGSGYTLCRIYIADLPSADRWWCRPDPDNTPSPGMGPVTCPYCIQGLPAPVCSTNPAALRMWTIYEKPRDYPHAWVAREWMVVAGRERSGSIVACSPSLEECRHDLDDHLRRVGRGGLAMLCCLKRAPDDDRAIVETWI